MPVATRVYCLVARSTAGTCRLSILIFLYSLLFVDNVAVYCRRIYAICTNFFCMSLSLSCASHVCNLFMHLQPTNYEVNLMEEHKKLRGLPRSRAEFQFTERARQLPCYGCHLFAAQDENNNAVLVGNSYRGISVFKEGTEVNFFR